MTFKHTRKHIAHSSNGQIKHEMEILTNEPFVVTN